jgi:DinB superfamily
MTERVGRQRGGASMASTTIGRPAAGEYAPYHGGYVGEVPEGDVLALLEGQGKETITLLEGVGERKSGHRYAAGKWSIREVVGHVIDAERVFTYRALTFARGDANALPGFDENGWATVSNAHARTLASLIDEFSAVRAATLALFRSFGDPELTRQGIASGHRVTVRGLLYVTTGHERHHVRILRERYLGAG